MRFDDIERRLHEAESRKSLFADSAFVEELFDKIDSLLHSCSILSIDVFDTLAMRDNSSELSRFFKIGGELARLVNSADGCDRRVRQPDAFLARYLGTKASYRAGDRAAGCREGSLTEIHRTASRLLIQSDEMLEEFVDAELRFEATTITKNEAIVEYALRHLNRGGRILLLTDMYMHADQVKRLLDLIDIPGEISENILSSADTQVSKASGGIFDLAESQFKAKSKDFTHLGDSLKGDFQQAIAHGWSALHLPVPMSEMIVRQNDHKETASMLHKEHGLTVDIAMPG
jgi:FMN phosphatase YigB (HAD superfamily)